MNKGTIITSEIKPTHRKKEVVEAWRCPASVGPGNTPDWVQSHYRVTGVDLTRSLAQRTGRWAIRDDEGYFWRWMKDAQFRELYEPIKRR